MESVAVRAIVVVCIEIDSDEIDLKEVSCAMYNGVMMFNYAGYSRLMSKSELHQAFSDPLPLEDHILFTNSRNFV